MVSGVWATGRPKMKANGDGSNALALAVPKPIREGKKAGIFRDVPKFFRGHLVCGTGITPKDNAFKECDAGWTSITRDDGRVMCTKAFTDGLAKTSYDQAMAFFQKHGAVLAPMESADEQKTILDMVKALNPPAGSMWIGARGKPPHSETFYWELDGRRVVLGMGTNWHSYHGHQEPNNANNNEDCLQLYTVTKIDKYGKWNDIVCENPGADRNQEVVIRGGVCAKYHKL